MSDKEMQYHLRRYDDGVTFNMNTRHYYIIPFEFFRQVLTVVLHCSLSDSKSP